MYLNHELFRQFIIKILAILFGLLIGWVSTSGTKSQNIRIIDIFIIGPLMIYFGWNSENINIGFRILLLFFGSTTITYNLKNYLGHYPEHQHSKHHPEYYNKNSTSTFSIQQKEKRDKLVNLLNPYEFKLLEAIIAKPNRVDFWISRKDPMLKHKKLLALYNRFFEIANEFEIEYWLEYGSLLGYCRHKGIMPWEWDMDIGITSKFFKKLKNIAKIINQKDKIFMFKYYEDPDYKQPAYSFLMRDDEDVLCDICEYIEKDDKLVCAIKEWNYPDWNREDIFPLRRVVMLGESALIMNNAEKVLSGVENILGQCIGNGDRTTWILNNISWMQYDPIPFLMTHLYHPDICEKVCSPPCKEIPIAKNIKEGLEIYGRKEIPFIVRNCHQLFNFDFESIKKWTKQNEQKTFGWNTNMDKVNDQNIYELLLKWENNTLDLNLVDSPIQGKVETNISSSLNVFGIENSKAMLVLSPKGAYTKFHVDEIAGNNSGGGWMYLSKGWKVWNLMDLKDAFENLYVKETKSLNDLPIDDLLYINNFACWGKIYNGEIFGGDFIYFPPGMAHRVKTYAKSIGLGGYIYDPKNDLKILEKSNHLFKKYDADKYNGLWK